MMSVKWKQHRHEKGYVYHEMTNEFYQVVGFIKPDGKEYSANVKGRSAFKRRTVKAAKADVEMIYEKLGIA
tara:strand:+ start:302 stop:514 length:213 start_codon:yes stop_codon:yes gene_type:complete